MNDKQDESAEKVPPTTTAQTPEVVGVTEVTDVTEVAGSTKATEVAGVETGSVRPAASATESEPTDLPSDAEPAVAGAPDNETTVEPNAPAQLRLRRAPRYRPFGVTGAALGVIAGVILALSFTAASNYSMQTIAGYFAAILGLIGALVGLGVAVLIERRRS